MLWPGMGRQGTNNLNLLAPIRRHTSSFRPRGGCVVMFIYLNKKIAIPNGVSRERNREREGGRERDDEIIVQCIANRRPSLPKTQPASQPARPATMFTCGHREVQGVHPGRVGQLASHTRLFCSLRSSS
jgi:hypothetical protein